MFVYIFSSTVFGRRTYGKGRCDLPKPEAQELIKKGLAKRLGPALTDKPARRQKFKPKRSVNAVVDTNTDGGSKQRGKRGRGQKSSASKSHE